MTSRTLIKSLTAITPDHRLMPSMVSAIPVVVRNLLLSGNLASLTLATRPREMVTYLNESQFLYRIVAKRRRLRQRNVFQVLPIPPNGVEQIALGNLQGGTWVYRFPSFAADLINLCLLARLLKPRTIFEIGTLRGYTAYHFALNAPDATVYTLDLPPGDVGSLPSTAADAAHIDTRHGHLAAGLIFDGTPQQDAIVPLHGDSATFDYTPFHDKIDLFWIDGAHSYDYVRSDTQNALQCVRPGGVIAWHDYGRAGVNGVSTWLHEFAAQGHEVYSIPGGSLAFHVVR